MHHDVLGNVHYHLDVHARTDPTFARSRRQAELQVMAFIDIDQLDSKD